MTSCSTPIGPHFEDICRLGVDVVVSGFRDERFNKICSGEDHDKLIDANSERFSFRADSDGAEHVPEPIEVRDWKVCFRSHFHEWALCSCQIEVVHEVPFVRGEDPRIFWEARE